MKSLIRTRAGRLLMFAVFGLCVGPAAELSAGTIVGSFSPIAAGSNVDLSIAGKMDWVHWGLYTDSSINRKAGVAGGISDFSILGTGYVYAYQYADNYNGYTWHDGWAAAAVTNTPTGVWVYQAYPPQLLGSGFQITAPADTTWKTLQVFVGAYAAGGALKATMSDGGVAYTDTSLTNSDNGPGGVYALNYKANSANQTLTVQWTLSYRSYGTNSMTGNVTLQAAALTATNANNPPWVTLTDPADLAAFTAPANLTMDAAAEDFDGTVTNVDFYSGTNLLGQRTSSPYSFVWSNAPAGHYYLSAVAKDNQGGARTSPPVEVFVYGSGGSLSGFKGTPSSLVDLTAEGTADWIHWGLATNTSVDRKAGVTPQISNFTEIGTDPVQQYGSNFATFSWSDGTPTLATNTDTGVFVMGVTNGFRLSLPADTTSRTAKVYVGGYGEQASFEAFLSDLSAPPFTDQSVSSVYGNDYAVYALTYAAASAGQTLNIIYHTQNLFDYDFGNVTLQAVSLEGGTTPMAPIYLTNAFRAGSNFVFSFNSQTGHSYAVQYANALPPPAWSNLTTIPGSGGLITVTNYNVTGSEGYYRVQAQ